MTPPNLSISPDGLRASARHRLNFRWKLTLLNGFLITVISLFFFFYIPNHLKRQAIKAIEEKANTVTEMSTYALLPGLALDRLDEAEETLRETARLEDVAYALVLSPENEPLATVIRDSTLSLLYLADPPHNRISPDGRIYDVHRPIVWRNKVLGELHMGFSLAAVNQSLIRSRTTIALVSFLVFLFGIIATLCISAFITRPLLRIVHAAEAIAGGDLKQRAPVLTHDEIGQLAYSFNGMVDSLNEAYEALRDSESRFRALSEHASDITLIIDRKAKINYVSPVCKAILGYSTKHLVGHRALSVLHPDDRRRALRTLLRERDGSKIITLEARVQHRNGSWRTLSFRARNLIDHPGINGILVNARDVTENKKFERELVLAKEQAEEMVRLKDAFLTNMSHEIRTPLTGILGFAQILLSEVGDDYRPLVASIEQSGQRLLHTLNSVLDLAQLEADSVHLKLKPLNVYEESLAAVRLLQPLALKKGLTLDVRTSVEEPVACLDRAYLNRILNNLVGNGIKFTDEGSVIVNISTEGNRLLIAVRDTGIGIDEAFLSDLFSEFKQESSGIGREYEGNGLGLTITKRLVELMNGTIDVESIKGLGSVFTVAFPLYQPAPIPEERPIPQPRTAAPRRAMPRKDRTASLLAVDDNPDVRMLLNRWLGSRLSVTTVKDSATALAEAKKHPFDVVLMDISLREERDGVSVMRDLRTLPGFENTLFVALTAFALPGDRERFLEDGFDAYLSKPFTRQKLTSLLDELLHRKSTTRPSQVVS